MRLSNSIRPILLLFVLLLTAANSLASDALTVVPLATLNEQARQRIGAQPRIALAAKDAEVIKRSDVINFLGAPEAPNYLRALALLPNTVKPFAELVQAAIYAGQVEPEVKLAMGLRMAQLNGSPYVAAHMQRLLRATPRGQNLLAQLQASTSKPVAAADQLALAYADALTRDVHGTSDADFQKLRGSFNDSQVVELTMTVCFFNYFTRMAEALNLPVETWALEGKTGAIEGSQYNAPIARVGLISDEEMRATEVLTAAAKDAAKQPNGLGLGIANSQRAMMRSPAFALAWRAYGNAVREYAVVNREMKLHVSFAVSMANGCRYCTLHQVLGLRRLGVDPAKLLAMRKSDAALTPRELTAVVFARKLTREPASISDEDFARLKTEFTEQGAAELLLQTCAFNFMNRLTDGLHLPSEDEAIRVYKETYGQDFRKSDNE
jgi:AhpD family alkylhydroperoxidase